MSVVTELVALLRLQTDKASFQQGENSIKSLVAPLEAALGADLLGKLAHGFSDVAKQAADLADVSAELGITTDRLQSLQYAGQLGGLSAEALTTALGRLAAEAGAANSGLGTQAALFQRLGVHTKGANGEILGTGELLPQIADGIQKLSSHTERAAAVQAVFGRGSRALIPILERGRDGLAELDAQFQALGGGFTKEQIAAADKYDDQLVKLSVSAKSLGGALLQQVLPGVQRVSELFTGFVSSTKGATEQSGELGAALALTTGLALAQGVAMLWSSGQGKGLLKLTALVGGLSTAWGDVRSALLGGNSVIGEIIGRTAGIEKLDAAVRHLSAGFEVLADLRAGKNTGVGTEDTIGMTQRFRFLRQLGTGGARTRTAAEEGEFQTLTNRLITGPAQARQRAADAAGIGRGTERGLGGAALEFHGNTLPANTVNTLLQAAPMLAPDSHAETNSKGETVIIPNVNVNVTAGPGTDHKELGRVVKKGVEDGLQQAATNARHSRASRVAKPDQGVTQ
jgi:hypothetical protein